MKRRCPECLNAPNYRMFENGKVCVYCTKCGRKTNFHADQEEAYKEFQKGKDKNAE